MTERNDTKLIVLRGGNEARIQERQRRIGTIIILVSFLIGVFVGYTVATQIVHKEPSKKPLPTAKVSQQITRTAKVAKPPMTVSRNKPVMVFEATAYTYTGNNTATGKWPTPSYTVAVDPAIIPMGSHLTINGVPGYVAEDTGGDIQGYRVDIFMSTAAEALDFGRRPVAVQVEE